MLIHTPGALCDSCNAFTEGDPDDLLANYGFTEDDLGNTFCGKCTEGMLNLESSVAPPEELAAMGEVIENDPAVVALGDGAGMFLNPPRRAPPEPTAEQLSRAAEAAERYARRKTK